MFMQLLIKIPSARSHALEEGVYGQDEIFSINS